MVFCHRRSSLLISLFLVVICLPRVSLGADAPSATSSVVAPNPADLATVDDLARAVQSNPNDPLLRLAYADALHLSSRADEAIAQYDEVLAVDKYSVEAMMGRACCYRHENKAGRALAEYRNAWMRHQTNPEAVMAFTACAFRQGRLRDALPALTTLARTDKPRAAVCYWSVAVWMVEKDYWAAQGYARTAHTLDPESFPASTLTADQVTVRSGSSNGLVARLTASRQRQLAECMLDGLSIPHIPFSTVPPSVFSGSAPPLVLPTMPPPPPTSSRSAPR